MSGDREAPAPAPKVSLTYVEIGAEEEEPHEALFLVLSYLPLFELLSMSAVCLSLRDAVEEDSLLWRRIIVDRPLSFRLSDEILIRIAGKANGRLETLALINCLRITDYGLQRVVENNPLISKLHIPGCSGLTPEGVVTAVKTLCEYSHSLKSLMIRGIYNHKYEHLEALQRHLHMNRSRKLPPPLLYHEHNYPLRFVNNKYERMIDVEVCPRCSEIRNVFDCTRESCKMKRERSQACCRGCNFCIPRCEECGGCVESGELEEAVCGDILCSSCWLQLPKCNCCNRPYCKRHGNEECSSAGSAGFVCEVCQ